MEEKRENENLLTEQRITVVTAGRKSETKLRDVDGGWAWVVCLASFTTHLLFNGQVCSGSIYFVIFLQEFEQSRSAVTWVFSAYNAAVCLAGPVAGLCLKKWGPRRVVIAGSLIAAVPLMLCYFATSILYLTIFFALSGAGGSLLFTSGVAAPTLYFQKLLFVATGIAISGSGLGIVMIAPLLEWAVDTYGWRGAILLHGGLMLQATICGSLMFPKKPTKKPNQQQSNDKNVSTPTSVLLKDARTWLIIGCMFFHFLTFTSFILVLKDFVIQERSLSVPFSFVAVVLGLCNTVARVGAGFIAKFVSPSILFTLASFDAAVALLFILFLKTEWVVVCLVGMAAFGFGLQPVSMNLMTASMFKANDMAMVFACGLFTSVFGIITAPAFGYMKDVSGSYMWAVLILVICLVLAGLCSSWAFIRHKKTQILKQKDVITEENLINDNI